MTRRSKLLLGALAVLLAVALVYGAWRRYTVSGRLMAAPSDGKTGRRNLRARVAIAVAGRRKQQLADLRQTEGCDEVFSAAMPSRAAWHEHAAGGPGRWSQLSAEQQQALDAYYSALSCNGD